MDLAFIVEQEAHVKLGALGDLSVVHVVAGVHLGGLGSGLCKKCQGTARHCTPLHAMYRYNLGSGLCNGVQWPLACLVLVDRSPVGLPTLWSLQEGRTDGETEA